LRLRVGAHRHDREKQDDQQPFHLTDNPCMTHPHAQQAQFLTLF
jgi:hypothetical protein